MKKYDLAVIGGGFAGVAAALAAARGGADVIIIEKSNSLGGAANICLVNPFMPYKTKIDGKEVALSAGIFSEIHQKLEARGAMRGETFLEEELKYVMSEMTVQTIGHDKINQLRHVRFFKDIDGMREHMKKHAAILRPKFEAVWKGLEENLAGLEGFIGKAYNMLMTVLYLIAPAMTFGFVLSLFKNITEKLKLIIVNM